MFSCIFSEAEFGFVKFFFFKSAPHLLQVTYMSVSKLRSSDEGSSVA